YARVEALGYIGSSKMSQDDEGLPSQLTHALLSEDSRSELPPRRSAEMLTPAPAVVAAASAYAPFAARPVAAPVAAPGPVRTAPVAAPTIPQPQQQQQQQVVAPQQQQQVVAAAAQPQQQQQQQQVRQGAAVAGRWQNKNETAAQTAIWNCVYYNVHTYQQSILSEMGTLIAAANAKANPGGGVNVAPQKVVDHLKAAVKRMNVRLIELRSGNSTKIEYNTTIMSKLITTQNKIITDELEQKLGMNLASLAPHLDLDGELKKRSDTAYLAVKNKVDRAKRSEAHKAAIKAASANAAAAAAAASSNSPAVAMAAAAVAAASIPR
ncbi:unnamed protein product, partial [Ectocarpus fasciculatus]